MMPVPHPGKPGSFDWQPVQALSPFPAVPVVLPKGCQGRVPERQLRLGQIAPDEILLLRCQSLAIEKLSCEEQAGAAIEQESRGFGHTDAFGFQMTAAAI